MEPRELWGKLNTTIGGLHYEGSIETLAGNYLEFYKNVFAVIRDDAALAVKPEESRNVIRLIEACYESHRLRKTVNV
jgi:hypothetical protein